MPGTPTARVKRKRQPVMTKANIHCRAMTLVVNWPTASAAKRVNEVFWYEQESEWLTERQNGQLESHSIILESQQEEGSQDENSPDDDVGQDSCGESACMYHRRTIPKDGHICPRQRSGHDGNVDKAWIGRMAEIQRGQIEEIDNQEDLALPKEATDPQHDETECEEVILA